MGEKQCFIVMPFGNKPFADGSGRQYDFDKVYRVIIQRAVREVGMLPIRADERVGSALIHTDMFRDLRDRAVVLADLSLDNPNVFYELGVRHVMSPRGTVLMCRKGAALPFDVKLSRVIFYDFDGANLDWEEVESVVKQLKVALPEALKGQPDSPVHALLESVLATNANTGGERISPSAEKTAADAAALENFQRLVAEHWRAQARAEEPPEGTGAATWNAAWFEKLFKEHRRAVFGARALAYYCLTEQTLPAEAACRLANHLNDGQQYELANRIYAELRAVNALNQKSLLAYASSMSEAEPDITGAQRAISLASEALSEVDATYHEARDSDGALMAYAQCHRRLAGLYQWHWQLSLQPSDLQTAIASFDTAIASNQRARDRGLHRHPGFLAQARLKQLVLLRIRDDNPERADSEGHRDKILALFPKTDDQQKSLSYLGWYQAITFADLGEGERAQRKAMTTFSEDAVLGQQPEHWEIGRRQYTQLRRFLEQYSPHLRHPTLIGRVSQFLQGAGA